MQNINYSEIGIDYESGLKRFSGHDKIYQKYLKKILINDDFDKLVHAMEEHDYEEAFRCAHTLKGIFGNLSITVMFNEIDVLVEQLRNQKDIEGAVEAFPGIKVKYDEFIAQLSALID